MPALHAVSRRNAKATLRRLPAIWVRQERRKPITKDHKQHVFSQLLFIERQRGYRHGWSANQYRSIFDVWPRGLNEVAATPTQEILNKVKSNQIAFSKRREKEVCHERA